MKRALPFILSLFLIPSYSSIIIVLDGLVSTGKTSICKEFIELYPEWVWIDQHQIYIRFLLSCIKEEFPFEYEVLAQAIDTDNLFHAIKKKRVLFKEGISDMQKIAALRSVDELYQIVNNPTWLNPFMEMVKQDTISLVEALIEEEKNMIVDSFLLANQEDIEYFKQYQHTFLVLAYCPLPVLIDRITKQDARALTDRCLLDMRSYKQALVGFQKYFIFSKQQHGSIDTVAFDEFISIFDEVEKHIDYFALLKGKNLQQGDISLQHLLLLKMQLLQTIKEGNSYIHPPPMQYDLIITTSKDNPKSFANLIFQFILENTKQESPIIYCSSKKTVVNLPISL